MQRLARHVGWGILFVLVAFHPTGLLIGDEAGAYQRLLKRIQAEQQAGRYREAEALAKDVVAIAEQHYSNRPTIVAQTLYFLAEAIVAQDRSAEAEALYRRSLRLMVQARGPALDVASIEAGLAIALHRQGRYAEAEPLFQRALEVREKKLRPDDLVIAQNLHELGELCLFQGRYKEAEGHYRRSLAIRQKAPQPSLVHIATVLNQLAICASRQERHDEAEQIGKRALSIREKQLGPDHRDVAESLITLGEILSGQARYAEAEPFYDRAIAIREKVLGPDHADVAYALAGLGQLYVAQSRFTEARPCCERIVAIREKVQGKDHTYLGQALADLAYLDYMQSRYPEAEFHYQSAISVFEKSLSADDPRVVLCMIRLSLVYGVQGRAMEGEALCLRALAIQEKTLGKDHADVAHTLQLLSFAYERQGRYAEAEQIRKRALAIREKVFGKDHLYVASSCNDLGTMYSILGRYAEAEPLLKRAIAIREKMGGPDGVALGTSLGNLGQVYSDQGRYAEAEPLHKRALAISEKTFGPEHSDVATGLSNLGSVLLHSGRYDEAEKLLKRSVAIQEMLFGADNPAGAQNWNLLSAIYRRQGRLAEAEALLKHALAVEEKALGTDHPDVGEILGVLAMLRVAQTRFADAEPLIDRAISIQERVGVRSGTLARAYHQRAIIKWKLGRKSDAVSELRRSMDLADQARGQSSGADRERAQFFSLFGSTFELMLSWQLELGDTEEALRTIDRSRARSLLDEMNRGKVDLNAGRSASEKERIHHKEVALQRRIAELEEKLRGATKPEQTSAPDAEQLRMALERARGDLVEHYRDELSTNPIYRNLITVGNASPSSNELQSTLLKDDGLALIYLFGEEGGYVLVISPTSARLAPLSVDHPSADALGTLVGPLTAKRLQEILIGSKNEGIVPRLAKPQNTAELTSRLEALYPILIPDAERKELASGKYKRLLVIPDGPLALFPFETLVVQGGDNPEYFLDNGPAILYAPSASVLYNLTKRPSAPTGKRKPVLTVANPIYPDERADDQLASRDPAVFPDPTSQARYAGIGGHLTPLPFTDEESKAVAEAFDKAGIATGKLQREQATEDIVRFNVAGRKIIHLACHGLTDQAYGNFFGALALTPGKQGSANALDDGFLTLPEIYELNLSGCELAILSACQTNYGPQQKGEGTWALSRGFLVAGARRIVASNWLVDDEAAASLISSFCNGLAQNEKSRGAIDYASQLQAAKKFIRNQEKWRSPYYWSTFVLVGPN